MTLEAKSPDSNDIYRNGGAEALKAAIEEAEPSTPNGPGGPDNIGPDAADTDGPAKDNGNDQPVTTDDFYAYMPSHQYIFVPTREMWPAASVDARLGKVGKLKASVWLDQNRAVEQMTWAPGQPMVIHNRVVSEGGWIPKGDVNTFNLYRSPIASLGSAANVRPWSDHLERLYGNDGDHIIQWLAHRRQRPGEKINHALVFGGLQGIGKDTILEPIKDAVGPWNFVEVQPSHLFDKFNSFVKSVILRVSEAHDLGDTDRYALYERIKVLAAAPPDVHRCNEKNLREHAVMNVCGVIFTTNHKTDGIYLPADDRRHFVAWSDSAKEDFDVEYWNRLYGWYEDGGRENVVAYLDGLNLDAFDPKAPPPKTEAFLDIVDANRAPEDSEMADAIERLKSPAALTVDDLRRAGSKSFRDWLDDRRSRRQIPHRMEAAGYVRVRSQTSSGEWKIDGRYQSVYAKRELALREQITAAARLSGPPI